MLYIGILLITAGIYLMIDDVFYIKEIITKREFIKRENFIIDLYYEFKLVLGIFFNVVGVFSILNYFMY